jgi:hypothetical protein
MLGRAKAGKMGVAISTAKKASVFQIGECISNEAEVSWAV